jgi:hypothetical protein
MWDRRNRVGSFSRRKCKYVFVPQRLRGESDNKKTKNFAISQTPPILLEVWLVRPSQKMALEEYAPVQ